MIARVFPRRTKASPDDPLAFFGLPGLWPPEVDEVHISVAFTYDKDRAEQLAHQWEHVAPVKLGGPAYGKPSGAFVPGMYVKQGYTITSRGCPNRCWFCSVPTREPRLIELEIHDGWNILDDNLLACSEGHIRKVFAMLKRQKKRAEFTGGLEAAILRDWHVDLLVDLKPAQMFFAYDEDRDYEPLRIAMQKLTAAGFNRHTLRCYCLVGYPKDTLQDAEKRLRQVVALCAYPQAMLWRNERGERSPEWITFARAWSRPAIISAIAKEVA